MSKRRRVYPSKYDAHEDDGDYNSLQDDRMIPLEPLGAGTTSQEGEEMIDPNDTGLDIIDRQGYTRPYCWTPMLVVSGWFLTVIAAILMIFSAAGFFRFVGGYFFVDFVAAWTIPLLLQGPAATVQRWAKADSRAWPILLLVYCIFCLVLVVFEFASAIYGLCTEFNASYAGSNNYYFAGIWIAIVITIFLVVIEIWHLTIIVSLLPKPRPPQGTTTLRSPTRG